MATATALVSASARVGGLAKKPRQGASSTTAARPAARVTSLVTPAGPALRRKPTDLAVRPRSSAALVSWFQNPFGETKEAAVDSSADCIQRLTAEQLPGFISSAGDNLCVVDYYTKWCGPCKLLLNELCKMSLKYKHVQFGKYDCEDVGNEHLASELNVHELPTVIMYRGGVELKRFTGVERLGEVMGMVELWDEKAQNGSLPPC